MPIDVLNHMWVGVFSASLVEQFAAEGRRQGSPGAALEHIDRFTEEAMAVADAALESYQRVCAKEARTQSQ